MNTKEMTNDKAISILEDIKNQSDQPEDITDEEWEQREKDWDEAIGPDYIPINHGMLFTFLDFESYDVEKKMIQEFDNAMEKVKALKKEDNL